MPMDSKDDEVLRKFSKTFRKVMLDNRENAGDGPNKTTPGRSVKFNSHVMETSLGGTQSLGRVKFNDSVLSCMSLNSSCTSSASSEDLPMKSKGFVVPKLAEDGSSYITPVKQPKLHTLREEVSATPECFRAVTLETPRPKARPQPNVSIHEKETEEDMSSVTVAVRCRPFAQRELAEDGVKCVISMDDNMTTVSTEGGASHKFSYDYSFWSFDQLGGFFASQEYVYNALAQPLLGKAFEGYNVCLFAYGQTGSGKSYSIMGQGNELGIIPRFCEELFGRVSSSTDDEQRNINVEISFFEIYNEKIHDLLGQTKDKLGRKATLKVREHPALGPFVEGLSSYVVKNYEDVEGWLNVGNKHRATAATAMNDKSSRSHSVFTMVLTQTKAEILEGEEHQHSITSKINLVDLAGSERQSAARTSGDRLKKRQEGSSINKSLLTLGKVISLLAERSQSVSKKVYIPYRDSVLTWLLKESLGGNSKTTMLATISPANLHMEETLSTLRYARQASKIVNSAKVNEDPNAKLIRELRAEIERLRRATGGVVSDDVIGGSDAEIESLRQQLLSKEQEMDEMTRSWQERLKQSEERKLEEAKQLEKSGISFKVDNKEPNLVNLSEDPLLSETLLYILKGGLTRVGRLTEGSRLDIQLKGPLIEENHCTLTNYEKTVSIKPIGEAQTYVNGTLITGPTVLHHGDRVILGGDHYFRFNHPGEVMERRSLALSTNGGAPCFRDFEFARQELMKVQNDKLQAELEEVKAEMEAELERQKSQAEEAMVKELERKKAEAEQELNQQQRRYEEKMKELQQTFKHESEQDKLRAKEEIERLRHEKMVLEQGILGDRKSLQLEAEAAQRAVVQSRQSHSRIVEQLELEKQKIVAHVERLQAQRNARGKPLPGLGVLGSIPVCDGLKKDFLKISLLLREANKIVQYFKKDVFFSREDVEDDKEAYPMVRVMKQSLEIWTFWTMDKFETRLLQIREIYQNCYQAGDSESSELEEIFNDPKDTWEKKEKLFGTPKVSPRMRMAQSRRNSVAQVAMRRSIDSSSPASPIQKMSTTPVSPVQEEQDNKNMKNKTQDKTQDKVPVIGVCRELIALSLDNFKGAVLEESLADKVLVHCELVKTGVTNILDAYNKALDNKSKELFLNTEVVRIGSIQISCSLRQLLTLCGLWTSSYNGIRSVTVLSLCDGLMSAVRQLGSHLALFMQGCENDIDKLVQSSASQLLTSLLSLCQHAGELSLATGVIVTVLNERVSSGEEDEETRLVLSDQVKQDFLSGCDNFVDKTFQRGIKTLEKCETRVRNIVDEQNSPVPKASNELNIYSDIDVLVSTAKVLMQKCQSIQVELDTTLRDTWETRPDRYYHKNYHRSVALVEHSSNFAEKLDTLIEVASARYAGKDDGSLRKIYRTVETIEKCGESLVTKATQEIESDSQDGSEASVLSDNQVCIVAGHDLQGAAKGLREKVKKLALETREAANSTPRKEVTDNKSNTSQNVQNNSNQKTETPIAVPRRKLPQNPEEANASPRQES